MNLFWLNPYVIYLTINFYHRHLCSVFNPVFKRPFGYHLIAFAKSIKTYLLHAQLHGLMFTSSITNIYGNHQFMSFVSKVRNWHFSKFSPSFLFFFDFSAFNCLQMRFLIITCTVYAIFCKRGKFGLQESPWKMSPFPKGPSVSPQSVCKVCIWFPFRPHFLIVSGLIANCLWISLLRSCYWSRSGVCRTRKTISAVDVVNDMKA